MVAKIKGIFVRDNVSAENKGLARQMYSKSRFGEVKQGKIQYSLVEGAYLLEKKKIDVVDYRGKKLKFDGFLRRVRRIQSNFWIRYCVFRDLRNRGYIVKTALKFGADFRVYERGIKPGKGHAKWIVYPFMNLKALHGMNFLLKTELHILQERIC